MTDISSIMRIN